jgi:hypothetical protein
MRRKVLVGTKAQYPAKTSAVKQVAALGLDINGEPSVQLVTPTLTELVDHHREIELIGGNGKTARTIAVYEPQIRQYILPKWGTFQIGLIKAVAVEGSTRRPGNEVVSLGLPKRIWHNRTTQCRNFRSSAAQFCGADHLLENSHYVTTKSLPT